MPYLITFSVLLSLVIVPLFIWMAFFETRRFRVWRLNVPFAESEAAEPIVLPANGLPESYILHVTDTHFSGNGKDRVKLEFIRSAIQEADRLDFVFLTGDILDSPPGLDSCLELAEMSSKAADRGAYAVLGGHDFYRSTELWRKYLSIHKNKPSQSPSKRKIPNPVNELRDGMKLHGVEVLEDSHSITDLENDDKLAIVGLNDTFFFQCDHSGAWEGLGDIPTIVLAHSPDVLPEIVERGAEIAFFGHTHGGQIRLPFKGAIVTRSMVGARRARGIFREKGTLFTINQGLGATRGTHIRLLCPPEVTLMHLGADSFQENYVQYRNGNFKR